MVVDDNEGCAFPFNSTILAIFGAICAFVDTVCVFVCRLGVGQVIRILLQHVEAAKQQLFPRSSPV